MADTHTLTGTLQTADTSPIAGAEVTIYPVAPEGATLRVDDAVVIPQPVTVTTDDTGRFSVSLLPRAAFEPVSVLYRVVWDEPVVVAGRTVQVRVRGRLISMPGQDADLADETVQVSLDEDENGDTIVTVPASYSEIEGAPDESEAWPTPPAYDTVSGAPSVDDPWPGGGGGSGGTVSYADITGAPATSSPWPTPPAYTDVTGAPASNTAWPTPPAYDDVTGAPATNTAWPTAPAYSDIDGAPSVSQIWPGGSYADITGAPVVTQAWPTPPAYTDITGTPTIPTRSTATPVNTGTASAGTSTNWAAGDHDHGITTGGGGSTVTVLLPQSLTVDSTETLQVGPAAYRSEMPVTASTTIPITGLGTGSLASNLDATAHTFTLTAGAYLLFVHLNQVWNTDEDGNALRNRSTIAASITGTLPAGSFHTPVPHYFRGAVDDNPAQAATQEYLFLPEDTTVGLALVGYPGIGEDTNATARNTSYRCTVDQVVLMPLAGVTVS